MAIQYRSATEPALAAATGTAIGKAEAKKKEQEIDWERESEIRANQLKMSLQEQEIIQQEANRLRSQQIEANKILRAREWEVEKMELRSRNDFIKEEEERQKANTEFENQLNEIDKQAVERGWDEDNPNVWNQKVQAALRVKDHNILKANQILGVDEALEQERKEAESVIERRRRLEAIHGGFFRDAPLSELEEEEALRQAELGITPKEITEGTEMAPAITIKSPYPEYPDAFFEDGIWKVIRNNTKYRIEE